MKRFQDVIKNKAKREVDVGHKIEWTRRDFLAHGLYSFSACLALPSLPALVAKSAFAATSNEIGSGFIPFMCFDMAGGAALAGNFLVGKDGGPDDWLASYSTLGWNPRGSDKIDRRFGLPMAANKSGIFAGLVATMSPEAQARLRFASVCHFSPLDTGAAKQNMAALATVSGAFGRQFKNGLASLNSLSGGNSDTALTTGMSLKPSYFDNLDSLKALARFGGPVDQNTDAKYLSLMARASNLLTAEQIETVQSGPGSRTLRDRVRQYLAGSGDGAGIEIDPRTEEVIRRIYNIARTTSPIDSRVIQATIVRNVIKGIAGTGVWTLGGCDYHTGNSQFGDAQDREMGEAIGRAVEYAHSVGAPFFFQLITDGSCSAPSGTRNWRSDTNEGMQIFGYYRPEGAPEYNKPNMQIGCFTNGQGADRSTLVGADPHRAALAVFANYCHIQGKLDEFKKITRVFSDRDIEQLLVFSPN
jgi:hypothetical protein